MRFLQREGGAASQRACLSRTQELRGIRVVVVGAGLAGLVAARDLSRRGADVRIIEARDRLGGRVWTVRDPPMAPFYAEAGGEFVDADQHAIRTLATELGLGMARILREGFGLAIEHDGRLHVHATQVATWRSLRTALRPAFESWSRAQHDWQTSVAAALARHSVGDLLQASGASARACAAATALRGFFLADPPMLSSLVLLEQLASGEDPGRAVMYRIRGGNDRLIEALRRRSRVAVATRHVVRTIEQSSSGVRVKIESPQRRLDRLVADYAVITAPVPALLSWSFEPPLPHEQRRAFEALAYGQATKTLMRFDARWWRREGRPRAFGSNLPVGAVWESGEEQRTHQGRPAALLTLLGGGQASAQLQDLVAAEGAAGILQRLRWLGRPPPDAVMKVVTWERDEWARGGYAVFTPRFEPAWRDLLARAFARVLFAGEHTSRDWQGYMNGAVESGHRVAIELADLERIRQAHGRMGAYGKRMGG